MAESHFFSYWGGLIERRVWNKVDVLVCLWVEVERWEGVLDRLDCLRLQNCSNVGWFEKRRYFWGCFR